MSGTAPADDIEDEAPAEAGPRPAVAAGIGAALLLFAAILWFDALSLPPGPNAGVGPGAAIKLTAVFIAVLGVAHFLDALRRRKLDPRTFAAAGTGHRAPLAWVLGALGGLMLCIQVGGGFIIAAAWLFVLSARGFGAPIRAKSIAIGVVLSTLVYLFFTKALSLGLPAGPIERLLG